MVILANKIGDSQPSFSYEELAEMAGLGRTKTYQSVNSLEAKKYIKKIKTRYKNRNKYQVLNKAVVQHMNDSTVSSSRDERLELFSSSPDELIKDNTKDYNTKEISKEKISVKEDFITSVIELFNKYKGHHPHSPQNVTLRELITVILNDKRMKSKSWDEKLADFDYVFDNKKKQADDPNCNILSPEFYRATTLLAKKNFFNYLLEDPYGEVEEEEELSATKLRLMQEGVL
jgi:DNA-binding Lrp family transcriptional regulator